MVSYAFSSQMTRYAVSKSVGSSLTSHQRKMIEGMAICLRMNNRLSYLGGLIASKIIIALSDEILAVVLASNEDHSSQFYVR